MIWEKKNKMQSCCVKRGLCAIFLKKGEMMGKRIFFILYKRDEELDWGERLRITNRQA